MENEARGIETPVQMNNDAALCPLDVEICNSWPIYTSDKTIN